MNKMLFENLAKLESRRKELEIEIELARHAVLQEMQKGGADTVKAEVGTFTVTTRKKWAYSDEVKVAETNIKNLKKVEEETGIAKFEESKSLLFRPKKADDPDNPNEVNPSGAKEASYI